MKYIIFVGLFSLIFIKSYAQVEDSLLYNAQLKDQKAATRLDSIYKNILKKYKSDAVFIKMIKNVQLSWGQLFDMEMQIRFHLISEENSPKIPSMCFSLYRAELTNERADRLQQWLDGVKDSTCAGSIQVIK